MDTHEYEFQTNDDIPNTDMETHNLASQQQSQSKNKFGPQSKKSGSIIRGFKIGVTKYARNNNIEFEWQPRYRDRIIRTNEEFARIRKYILDNPVKWKGDEFNNN